MSIYNVGAVMTLGAGCNYIMSFIFYFLSFLTTHVHESEIQSYSTGGMALVLDLGIKGQLGQSVVTPLDVTGLGLSHVRLCICLYLKVRD